MISEVKSFTSKKGTPLQLVEVTGDKKSGVKLVVMKTEYGISVCPEVNYFSKAKDTWIKQQQWFRFDQWTTMVALQSEVCQAVEMLGGETTRIDKDVRSTIEATAAGLSKEDDDDIMF